MKNKKTGYIYIYIYTHTHTHTGTSQAARVIKNLPANSGVVNDAEWTSGLGRSPGGGYSNPLQYSCLENLIDRRSRWVFVHRVAKRQTRLKQFSKHAHICTHICNGILFSFQKEGNPDTCYNLEKS